MFEPTAITWVIIIFGIITNSPLLYAQSVMIIKPNSEKAKTLMIGKGEDWRDRSHFRCASALAKVDWLIFVPLLIAGIIGIALARSWGYLLFGASGAIVLYINVFCGSLKRSMCILPKVH